MSQSNRGIFAKLSDVQRHETTAATAPVPMSTETWLLRYGPDIIIVDPGEALAEHRLAEIISIFKC